MAADESLIGTGLSLVIADQQVKGKVIEVLPNKLVVELAVRQPASDYYGELAQATLPDGRHIDFDLSRNAYFAHLVVEVPLPAPIREARSSSGDSAASNERRRYFRLATDLDLEVIDGLSGREVVRATGRTLNLSGGGMLVQLTRPLATGLYRFRLHLPSESLILYGRILGKGSVQTAAVEFVDLHEVERSKLIRFIFNKMRNIRESLDKKKKDEPRYKRRRNRFFQPIKIRYW
ncbi:MAG TPA: PilZ domain-containing protein [Oscillatoriaceae cyanobacterium]